MPELHPEPHAASDLAQVAWLMDHSAEATMLTDAAGRIEYVNAAFEAMTGYTAAEVLGRTPALLKSGQQSPRVYELLWRTLNAGQEFRATLVNRRKNGELFHEEKSIRPLFDAVGRITHYLSCGRDVSERVAAMAQLRRAATHDALTGLPNRALFLERVDAAIAQRRAGGPGFTLALADLDGFKGVNDGHGHAVGDAVLRWVAQRLQHGVRRTDTVARLGGDEFGLLLQDGEDEASASQLLGSIVEQVKMALHHDGAAPLRASISIGACVDTTGEMDALRLLELADMAMYEVKRSGGDGFGVRVADPLTMTAPLAPAPVADASLPTRVCSPAAPVWRRRSVRAGEPLYRQGQRLTHLYVLRRGSVRVTDPAAAGPEAPAALRAEGDWLGLDGLGTRRHRRDACALDDGELWVIGYDELLSAASRSRELLASLLDALGRELHTELG